MSEISYLNDLERRSLRMLSKFKAGDKVILTDGTYLKTYIDPKLIYTVTRIYNTGYGNNGGIEISLEGLKVPNSFWIARFAKYRPVKIYPWYLKPFVRVFDLITKKPMKV